MNEKLYILICNNPFKVFFLIWCNNPFLQQNVLKIRCFLLKTWKIQCHYFAAVNFEELNNIQNEKIRIKKISIEYKFLEKEI